MSRMTSSEQKNAELSAKGITMLLAALLLLTLIGCSSPPTVQVEVERPPTLDTRGIKRIAVMPFEYDDNAYSSLASYATSAVASTIGSKNYFTLVDAAEVTRLKNSSQNIENYVDAIFKGRITRATVDKDVKSSSYTDKKGNTYTSTTYYTNVEVEFNYSLMVARDGRLIGPVTKKGVGKATASDGYPSAEKLLNEALNSQITLVYRDVAPYKLSEQRRFAEDKTIKDKEFKTAMENALETLKTRNYKLALNSYLEIYNKYKSAAAAENASIIYEVLGDTESAKDIMQKVFDETGNPNAQSIIDRLNKILGDKAKYTALQQEDTQKPIDKVTAFANEEIQKVLPSNGSVWFYNNSPGNTMVESVIDNLTADFIRKGIGVVDRQAIALVEAEQKLQTSGAVNDAEMVRIGNAAGAKAIAIIGITGSGSVRRLQVRVLDIERGIPIMQSDSGEKWQL